MRKSRLTGPRRKWYIHYRMMRIIRRESFAAYLDVLIYGTGFVEITTDDNYIRHIPAEQVTIPWEHFRDGQT